MFFLHSAGEGLVDLAILGYVYILEQAGIRFLGVGGSSCGALLAMLIAARRDSPDQPCSMKVLKDLASMPRELSKAVHLTNPGNICLP